ncbi:hypothetical protein DSOL_4625 [Desulfosporosinus metallidurans]|uniref:Uncharacterized protein n=1 Tax=Desulfosporosinus metallidurans TaxID=1888891 RepID=A0A1Q8QIX4_9FIRM|nr:hypothetical protein DSOL_4625 [Desulfosporosinus metallidurans]
MNLWSLMNWVAWGLSGILFLIMAQDFIKVEINRRGGGKP